MLVLIYGPPAAGKYTIGAKVADTLGYRFLHNHAIVDLALSLFDFGSEGFIDLRERLWLDSVRAAAGAGIDVVMTFNPEATVRTGMLDEIQAAFTDIVQVELTCPATVVEARVAGESRQRFGKLTDAELYRQLEAAGAFEFDYPFAPALQVDTGSTPAEEAAARIVDLLRGR